MTGIGTVCCIMLSSSSLVGEGNRRASIAFEPESYYVGYGFRENIFVFSLWNGESRRSCEIINAVIFDPC